MNPIVPRWQWGVQKTAHLYRSLVLRDAPRFVYARNAPPLAGEVPVFTFHTAAPDSFERQCRFLVENGYRTLTADEFLLALTRSRRPPVKSIVLTFDDGLKTVWTVAYPILKKYKLNAVCFLIPGCIPEGDSLRPTLDDVERAGVPVNEVVDAESGCRALMNWAEIKELHRNGVIDFQSHTLHHHVVPTSDRIFDFVNPHFDVGPYANVHIPVYRNSQVDPVSRESIPGLPIYQAKPRMQAERRYVDNDDLRRLCVDYVREHGGLVFFEQRYWRRRLLHLVSDYRARTGRPGRFETVDEREREVLDDLVRSREIIESRLPGHRVTHLCFPWYEAAPFAIVASRKAGYRANYFGNVWRRSTNRPGDNPLATPRIEGHLLERLPGRGRITLSTVLRRLYRPRGA